MRGNGRKWIVGFICLMLITACMSAAGAEEALTSGDYSYVLNEDGYAVITKYNGSETEVEIPSELDGYPVVGIGELAFFNLMSITSITLPDGINSIGNFAFCNCFFMESISLPGSLIDIGNGAFVQCVDLIDIVLPENVASIGDNAFAACIGLETIVLPESIASIGEGSFTDCSSLLNVIVSQGSYAEQYCIDNGLPYVFEEAAE